MRNTALVLICALMGGCGALRDAYTNAEVLVVDGCAIHIKGMKIESTADLQSWDFDNDCELIVEEKQK
jgi:uncharacterized metal-binding protein